MSTKIIAQNKDHLRQLIKKEIQLHGVNCDLNHIDVKKIVNMSGLFYKTVFNGDISKWDVSQVQNMYSMFLLSKFNGDISKWDVSSVTDMECMFYKSRFNQDISDWTPKKLIYIEKIFKESPLEHINNLPYWATVGVEFLEQAINAYWLQKTLDQTLVKKQQEKAHLLNIIKI